MQLTIKHRLRLCWEVLTIRSGHAHAAQEKQLSIFMRGYMAGAKDAGLELRHCKPCNEDGLWHCANPESCGGPWDARFD